MMRRIDLHMHTLLSDGVLTPIELARRAVALDHEAIAFTDHVGFASMETIIAEARKDADLAAEWGIKVLVGVELTHVPASRLSEAAKRARRAGAELIVVHGETISEPVEPGTNRAAANDPEVDILAHPGLISLEDAQAAADNGVALEITSRPSHGMTNGHVLSMARKAGARMVVNTDSHAPSDLISMDKAMRIALGAGMTPQEAEAALGEVPRSIVRKAGR